MNYRIVGKVLGLYLLFFGIVLALPALVALHYKEAFIAGCFILVALPTSIIGAVFYTRLKDTRERMYRKEGLLAVSAGWMLAAALGALPFYISREIPFYTDAFFETMSGFTTTGASILTNIEAMSRGLLFWRSFTHWLGGMGIIVLFIAILPMLGVGSKHLFRVEIPGPSKDAFLPRLRDTAIALWAIYLAISIAQFTALMLCGMDWFQAATHTFGTMATGGFSTYNQSIAAFNSPVIEWVIIAFMFMAGVNFSLYFQLVRGRLLFFRDTEFRAYLLIAGAVIAALYATNLIQGAVQHSHHGIRACAFQAVSILTTTGYTTENFDAWPSFARILLFGLMFIGASAGSTGGGLKIVRIVILLRWAWRSVIRTFQPQAIVPVRINKRLLTQEMEDQVTGLFVAFIGLFLVGTLTMSLLGHDFDTSMSASIACLGNIGPGLGLVGASGNYAAIEPVGKWVLSMLMMAGRLEVYALLVLLAPTFWRK